MALENKWVGYLERGYLQIKNSILNRVKISVQEITDFSESNIFVILISIFSGLVEQLNYYIDQLMRESFLVTARRYTSVVRHSKMFDYRIKAANPASTDLVVLLFKNGEPYTLQPNENETIPKGLRFESDNGLPFYSTKDVIAVHPNNFAIVPVSQFEFQSVTFSILSNEQNQVYLLGIDYVHDSISMLISSEPWEQVTSFGASLSTSKHFIIDIDIDGKAYIKFGNGQNGLIPIKDSIVEINYKSTSGKSGNIGPGLFSQMPPITLVNCDEAVVKSYNQASGGTGYEDIESIRRNIPLSLRTLNRAVTKKDYEDIAILHPGVNKAYIKYDCGKYVNIYISPNGGGIAYQSLLDSVKIWFNNYRMVTTFINVLSAGESSIYLKIKVVGKFGIKEAKISEQVRKALLDNYGYDKSNINKSIRVSDIHAIVDNQSSVDYVNIAYLWLKPFAFPINHNNYLIFNFKVLSCNFKQSYRLVFVGATTFNLYYLGLMTGTIDTGQIFNNGVFEIEIMNNNFNIGDSWEFTVYPSNTDIVIDDYSIPVLQTNDLIIEVQETISQ